MIGKTSWRGLEGVVHRIGDLPVMKRGMRWSYIKKGMILGAIRAGVLTEQAAGERYDLSPEEFREWGAAYDARGYDGLKVTKRAPHAANPEDTGHGRDRGAGVISREGRRL